MDVTAMPMALFAFWSVLTSSLIAAFCSLIVLYAVSVSGGAVVYWLSRSTSGREVAGSSPLDAGCRVATVGQLLFAPWASAYSTLHPFWVGKWVPATAGKV